MLVFHGCLNAQSDFLNLHVLEYVVVVVVVQYVRSVAQLRIRLRMSRSSGPPSPPLEKVLVEEWVVHQGLGRLALLRPLPQGVGQKHGQVGPAPGSLEQLWTTSDTRKSKS